MKLLRYSESKQLFRLHNDNSQQFGRWVLGLQKWAGKNIIDCQVIGDKERGGIGYMKHRYF